LGGIISRYNNLTPLGLKKSFLITAIILITVPNNTHAKSPLRGLLAWVNSKPELPF
jgi:hypothetical protein